MYTELIKIIEGGIIGDKEKVYNYANVLAKNLEKQGEKTLAHKIQNVLKSKKGNLVSLDSFATKPVDVESRMDIIEITYPQILGEQIVLSKHINHEINDFIEGYKNREGFLKLGLETTNSLLLYGPPGCGKTTIAQYISTITELPLVTARLDGLISSLLGSTAKNIRKIFDYVSKRECILFLDEFDVIAKLRDDKNELGELKRVVNSLIQNIDSLNNGSILIAATNHHKLLDSAIWRRFSTIITLDKPEKEEIFGLLKLYLENYNNTILNSMKKSEQLVSAFVNFSHSDIKTIINNTIKNNFINKRENLNNCSILREIYFYKNHTINDEEKFIYYLLQNSVTHKEINENFGFSLRRIQAVSKNEKWEENK